VADFNSDGTNDIYWRNPTSGMNGLWVMNGQSIIRWQGLPSVTDSNWRMISVGDLNLDGKADILWQNNSSGEVAVWLMNGATISSYTPIGNAFGYSLVGMADFDEDENDLEFIWQSDSTGQVGVWIMSGLTINSWQPFAAVPPTVWLGKN
jgi:hypothetical protein